MSAREVPSAEIASLAERPAFELECLFDDVDDPTAVTIFYPRGPQTVTEWITADVADTVGLDDVR